MTEHDVVEQRTPERPRHGLGPDERPLLTRLNARGLRLVQVADLLGIVAVLVGTMVVRTRASGRGAFDWPTYPMTAYLVSFTVITAVFLLTIYFGGLYEREPRLGSPPVLPRALQLTLGAGGLTALLILAATGLAREFGFGQGRALPIPITNLVILIVLGAAVITMNRRLVHLVRYRREGPPRVLLVGDPADIATARRHLSQDLDRALVVAEATDTAGLVERVEANGVTDVVLLSSRWIDTIYPDLMAALERRRVTLLQRVSAKETLFGLQRVREVGGMPFVLLRLHTMPVSREHFKRFSEGAVLLALSPVLVPLLAFTTLYQLVVAGRPLLYWQERVGQGGRVFRMVKFRTMTVDAERDTGVTLAERADPRVIPACRWIRATRLDELPQLWNILRGEMSLVGPRPERPELTHEFERQIPGYARRHELPPGITGLAQIQGRYHTDPEYKLGYDLQYLVNWSPVLDLQILLRTIWVVLARRV